jgi:hypothetical protein
VVTDRKDRQVLIEVPEQQLLVFSTDAIQEKLQQAIKMVENPLLPADTSIAHISKSRMTGVIINFNTKEMANWLRIPEVGHIVAAHFFTGAEIKPRHFVVIAPRVPVTFNPENKEHLREIEKVNSLDKNTVRTRYIYIAGSLGQREKN